MKTEKPNEKPSTPARERTDLPDGTRLRKVKFSQQVSVAWMHAMQIEDNRDQQNIRIVLSGPLVWIERVIRDGDTGREKRGVWAVPVTNVLWIAFPEEKLETPRAKAAA